MFYLTTISISIQEYRPDRDTVVSNFRKRIVWYGVATDARSFDGLTEIQNLNLAVQELTALAERPERVRKTD